MSEILELSRDECLALLSPGGTGRLVYTRSALPAVLTVDFLLDESGVLLRVPGGNQVGQATHGMVVAFQTDAIDAGSRCGWTVTVVGRGRVDRGPRPGRLPRDTWAAGGHSDLVLVETGIVTGRQVLRPAATGRGPLPGPDGPWSRVAPGRRVQVGQQGTPADVGEG